MQDRKTLFWSGVGIYGTLAILSVIFYKERTVFIDIAFHLFYILKDGALAIQNNRFGAVFTQLFPLMASKAGLSLSQVMIAYSMGFVIYYATLFFLCLRLSRPHALMLLLFNVGMVTDTFYWIQSEFSQGVAFSLLWWAVIAHYGRLERVPAWVTGLSAVMLLFVAFFHPVLAVVMVFLFAFHWVHSDYQVHKRLIFSGLVSFLGIMAVKFFFFKTTYDAEATDRLNYFRRFFPNYLGMHSNTEFLNDVLRHFYLLPVLLGITGVFYIRRKAWTKLALTAGFFFGYLLVVNVSYPDYGESFYMENLYLPLGLFVIVPFVLDVLPAWPVRWATGIVAAMLLLRVVHIGLNHEKFTARLEWERNYLAQTTSEGAGKMIVSERAAPMDTLMMSWGTAYEFWLLSTVEQGETRGLLIDVDPPSLKWTTGPPHSFVTKWGVFEYKELPQRYFIFKDTTTGYEIR